VKVGDLVRKFTSIKGVYNYGIVTFEDADGHLVKVAWANSNPKSPWIMKRHIEVISEQKIRNR